MDIVYARGRATVAEVRAALPDPPSYNAVRSLMSILEQKGRLIHREQGKQYVYEAVQPQQDVGKSALRRVIDTFFGGSAERVVATLLTSDDVGISQDEIARIRALISEATEREP
jgi:predicted transcriptional regulator